MCNVKCEILRISISDVEKLLKTKKRLENNAKIAIKEIIILDPEIVFPANFDLGTISIGSLRRFIKIKKFYREEFVFLREIEALKKGWKINDYNHWGIDEDDFFREFNSPKYQITEKRKENLNGLLFLLKEVKKEAEKNGIVSRIDEVIEEFLQLENIFFFKAKEKIFEKKEGKIYKTKSSCLKIFRLCLEKEYNNFLKVDVLFLKQLLSKAITVVDYVLGTETLAFDEALSELSRLVKK